MRNYFSFWPSGEAATIWLKRRNGEKIACTVDAADLPKLHAFRTTWGATWDSHTQSFRARCTVLVAGKKKRIYMHRFLMGEPRELQIDHWDHDTLNNRRCNLRVATPSANMMNRKGANRNSKSGHRGVSPHNSAGKFELRVTINGIQKYVGLFTTIEDALAVRNEYQGYGEELTTL